MANIPPTNTTTIYVSTESENAELSFASITHYGSPNTLEDGVYLSCQLGDTGVAIVDTDQADTFISQFNHAPGCSVSGYETH